MVSVPKLTGVKVCQIKANVKTMGVKGDQEASWTTPFAQMVRAGAKNIKVLNTCKKNHGGLQV